MVSSNDDRSFSVEEIRAATSNGHLPAVAERLARGRDFVRLISLYEQAAELAIPAALLTETVQRTAAALGRPGPAGRGGGTDPEGDSDDRRSVRLLAGEALLARAAQPALTETDRSALAAAGAVLADAGDLHRAARAFEAADNPAAAADLWGRLGELEAMEACLVRDEERRRAVRAGASALRDVEERLASGERVAALRILHQAPEGVAESRVLRQIALEVGGRMVRTRGVTLHVIHGRTVRFATTPAALGRDPLAEVPLRDPGVSRRHALLSVTAEAITLADTGSRLGTFVAGARLSEPAALGGDTEATLGPSCRLSFGRLGAGDDHVVVRGGGGLDAGLLALVGRGRLPVGALIPGAEGAWLEIDSAGVHLGHPPGLAVRLGGHLAAGRIDLLHGDRIDLGDDVTIEVP